MSAPERTMDDRRLTADEGGRLTLGRPSSVVGPASAFQRFRRNQRAVVGAGISARSPSSRP